MFRIDYKSILNSSTIQIDNLGSRLVEDTISTCFSVFLYYFQHPSLCRFPSYTFYDKNILKMGSPGTAENMARIYEYMN